MTQETIEKKGIEKNIDDILSSIRGLMTEPLEKNLEQNNFNKQESSSEEKELSEYSEQKTSIEELLNVETKSKTSDLINQLMETSQKAKENNNSKLEDLVIQTLKPILADWLNKNLPSIVENIVEKEIRKLT